MIKQTIIAIIILISLNSFSQTKADTLAANRFLDSIGRSSVSDFRTFIKENATAKESDFGILNSFIDFYIKSKYYEWANKKNIKIKI